MVEHSNVPAAEPVARLKSIKNWAEHDRPREKMLEKGQKALSDAELLAILIGSGSANESAVDLSKRILATVANNLSELSRLEIFELLRFKGIGPAKAINIVAALELGRRRRQSESLQRQTITSSQDAFELMQPIVGDLAYEEFWVITLNRSNKVKRTLCVSEGGVEGTVADPKKIFKMALEDNASGVILCHNHPSGALRPSENDVKITRKCKEAGAFLELPVLDHLIVGHEKYFSFADEGLL
jgi:DNA repair protein RadC